MNVCQKFAILVSIQHVINTKKNLALQLKVLCNLKISEIMNIFGKG
jgi:hypothetical protein